MKILMIIDSLELNGGSSMFLEMISGLRKYYPEHTVIPLVVSKTGHYGRKSLVSRNLAESYGSEIPSFTYEGFGASGILKGIDVIAHHRLQCTRPLRVDIPYVVINHTVQSSHRMSNFSHADQIISVCDYVNQLTSIHIKSKTILNGVENDYIKDIPPAGLKGKFRSGRCHRLVEGKLDPRSWSRLDRLGVKGHAHYMIGPSLGREAKTIMKKFPFVNHLGTIFDRQRKMSLIKDFHVYFYDTNIKEGASIAMLESLACGVPILCRPLGGNREIVRHKVNGYLFDDPNQAIEYLRSLYNDKDKLAKLRNSTVQDFNKRLHIKHMLAKYMRVFEKVTRS